METKLDWKRLLAPGEDVYRYECLVQMRWNGKPTCPHCNYSEKIYVYTKRKLFRCKRCDKQFSATSGTNLHSTKLPLLKWFQMLHQFTVNKAGVSSYTTKDLNDITQTTAWRLQHKFRMGMSNSEHFKGQLCGNIELDETFVGGKNKNRHYDKKVKNNQGRATIDKVAVFAMYSRDEHKLFLWPMARLHASGMQALVRSKVVLSSNVYTDEYRGYIGLDGYFNHSVVEHGRGNYVTGDAHTNTVEGFWGLLKRAVMGTYKGRVHKTYLARYCKEVAYRYVAKAMHKFEMMEEILTSCLIGRYCQKGLYLY